MAETDYNEILLEAIDAIVVSRISEVNFDRTIVATIVDASKAKDGEYVLSDGSVQFTVRNGSDKYKENDRVNVLIPSNDFSSTEKTILGKTSANVNDVPVTYVSPLEKIVPMETNYAAGLKGGIIANSETEIVQLTNAEWIEVNESTLGYDTLCVSARFKTLLNDCDIRQGHYGLLVQLKTKNGYIHALTLDSAKDMFGNPYGYSMYLTQEQTYHLNLQDNIIGIKIDLYQMKDFKYNDGVNSELQVLPVMPYNNILVDNINVSFGYNAEQIEDNTVKISTANSLTYNNIKNTSTAKKLTLTWYNKDENNKYLGFSDGHFAGQDKDNPLYEIKWYHSQNNGEWALLEEPADATTVDVEVNLRWAINEYKAVVIYDGNEYNSNILSFKAETGYDSNIHDQLNMELELRNGKDSLDSYPFYGADSAVINPGDAWKNREIEFVYSGAAGSKLESDILKGATVLFYIPTISTMLDLPSGLEAEDPENKEYYLEGYALYRKCFSSYNESEQQQLKTFKYRVKEFYNPLFNNNTVILKVIDKNGFEYSTKKTFSFSSYGTSGTDYTLVIEDPINKKATLYDADYKVVKTEFEDKDWSYWPSSIGTGTPTAAAGYAVRKLSTTVKWVGKTITLEAIKGIPWYPENSNYYYQGPTTITYDSAGVNPRYYAGDIGLYDKSTNEPIVGLTWTLRYYPKNKLIKDPQTSISIQGYPQLLIDESGTKAPKLKVPNMYFDQDYYLVLVANNSNGQAQWRQPLIILQNAYSSNLLNNWNGALSVDQGNNTILTAMVGAGSKDSDNRFSGVVMGDLEKLDANGNILNSEHGLLGFHEGAQSFGFKANGTAFIGKSGAGRIEFDGNSGIIESADETGMSINLSTGNITATNFNLNANDNNFILSSNSSPYVKIYQNENNYLEYNNSGLNIKVPEANLIIGNETVGTKIEASENKITSLVESVGAQIQFYGTCETAAATSLKSVAILNTTNFPSMSADKYPTGTAISVRFVNGNTSDTMKLSISHIAADSEGEDVFIANASKGMPKLAAGDSIIFTYDAEVNGGNGAWIIVDGGAKSQIKQTAESIKLSVNNKGTSSAITITGDNIDFTSEDIVFNGLVSFNDLTNNSSTKINGSYITTGTIDADLIKAGSLTIKSGGNPIFQANTSGSVTMGGWKVGNGYLYANDHGFVGLYSNCPNKITIAGSAAKDDWRIIAGNASNRNFGVDKNGALYSTSGKIGGWDISTHTLSSSGLTLGDNTQDYNLQTASISVNNYLVSSTTIDLSTSKPSERQWISETITAKGTVLRIYDVRITKVESNISSYTAPAVSYNGSNITVGAYLLDGGDQGGITVQVKYEYQSTSQSKPGFSINNAGAVTCNELLLGPHWKFNYTAFEIEHDQGVYTILGTEGITYQDRDTIKGVEWRSIVDALGEGVTGWLKITNAGWLCLQRGAIIRTLGNSYNWTSIKNSNNYMDTGISKQITF